MKTLTSALLGAGVLAIAIVGATQPASARVGVYVNPYGFGVQVDSYRNYCRDPWYRHRYWDYCRRFYSDYYDSYYDDGYYDDGYGGYYDGYYDNYYPYYGDRGFRDRRYHHDGSNFDWGDRGRHDWRSGHERGDRGRGSFEPQRRDRGGDGRHDHHDRSNHGAGDHRDRGRDH
jgi:hypothetical protein